MVAGLSKYNNELRQYVITAEYKSYLSFFVNLYIWSIFLFCLLFLPLKRNSYFEFKLAANPHPFPGKSLQSAPDKKKIQLKASW
jgi:hypothetical protein